MRTDDAAAMRAQLVRIIGEIIPETALFLSAISTGGGCEAMLIEYEGRRIEITDGDAALPFDDDEFRDLIFSYSHDGGDAAGDGYLTVEWQSENVEGYWGNVRASLQDWIDGNPWTDLESQYLAVNDIAAGWQNDKPHRNGK